MDSKTLWLVRHAKSDWPPGVGDLARPLAARGRRQGVAMGAWLGGQDAPAQWVLASPARRTQDTAAYVRDAFRLAGADVVTRPALYHAAAQDLLAAAQSLPEAIAGAAIVGHNPGITHCVNLLAGEPLFANLPTFGVVRVAFAGPWRQATFDGARVVGWMTPKRLAQEGGDAPRTAPVGLD